LFSGNLSGDGSGEANVGDKTTSEYKRRVRILRLAYSAHVVRARILLDDATIQNEAYFEQEVIMNTEFLWEGPIGLLYYAGPAWALLAIVVFLGLVFFVITRMNRE